MLSRFRWCFRCVLGFARAVTILSFQVGPSPPRNPPRNNQQLFSCPYPSLPSLRLLRGFYCDSSIVLRMTLLFLSRLARSSFFRCCGRRIFLSAITTSCAGPCLWGITLPAMIGRPARKGIWPPGEFDRPGRLLGLSPPDAEPDPRAVCSHGLGESTTRCPRCRIDQKRAGRVLPHRRIWSSCRTMPVDW